MTSEVPVNTAPECVTVGIDGSYWGGRALSWGTEHARLRGAQLRVLDPATDDPVSTLADASATSDLVVLGCRGHRHRLLGLGEAVLPTVAAAHCDVLVVRGRGAAQRGENHCVTAMVSGGLDDETVVARAAAMATSHHSRMEVVHAEPPTAMDDGLFAEKVRIAALRLRTAVTTVRTLPHEVIANSDGSDLIVLGRGRSPGRPSNPGVVTKAALHHAPCPVLVVHPVRPAARGARIAGRGGVPYC
jgi:nucleotide-binding universal stress UspA family protein